jgi:hypothetical protein
VTPRQIRDAANGPWVVYAGPAPCEYSDWREALADVPPGTTIVIWPGVHGIEK